MNDDGVIAAGASGDASTGSGANAILLFLIHPNNFASTGGKYSFQIFITHYTVLSLDKVHPFSLTRLKFHNNCHT
jgi:hypothetical protein